MADDKEDKSYWQRTKDWAHRNPVIAGAVAGGTAGSIIPGAGTVVGAVSGAVVGYIHKKSQ